MNRQNTISSHYLDKNGQKYCIDRFDEKMEFGRLFQTRYFKQFCDEQKDLLDFGCATGLFLRSLPARNRIGIEVNPHCLFEARKINLKSNIMIQLHETLDSVEDECVDVIISNHALEHVLNPLRELNHMNRVLRPGGNLIIVTPYDDFRSSQNKKFNPLDKDHHLFTWSPLNLGNLISEAGFYVKECNLCTSAWSPKIFWIKKSFGIQVFKTACFLLSILKHRREVFCLAAKP